MGSRKMFDSPAAGLYGNQEGLEPISKHPARQPSRVHQTEVVNASQFNLETLKQFVCRVVQLRVAELARYTTRTFTLAGDEQSSETTFAGTESAAKAGVPFDQWPNLRVVYTNSDFGHSLSNNEGCVGASVRKNARMAATEPTAAGRGALGQLRLYLYAPASFYPASEKTLP